MKLEGIHVLGFKDPYAKEMVMTIRKNFNRTPKDLNEAVKNGCIYTYNINGEAVGMITIKKYQNNYLFMDLYVKREYRTLGIGGKIMNYFLTKHINEKIILGSDIKNVGWFSKFSFRIMNKVGNIVLMELY